MYLTYFLDNIFNQILLKPDAIMANLVIIPVKNLASIKVISNLGSFVCVCVSWFFFGTVLL